MKEHTSNITAIVTVADDGGSSGALREELGIPPVGDIRNCIAALADAEPLMSDLLGYRFPGGRREAGQPVETEPGGLGGHAIGNLLIAALTAVEGGDFEEGVRRMNRVLAVRGQVLPASPTPITLHARTRDGHRRVRPVDDHADERASSASGSPPATWRASEDAVAAIAEAELIVLGPGSLYTSLLPVLLIPGIRDAVAASPARPDLRLQRRHPGRRDRRLRPRRPRRGAPRPHRAPASSTSSSPTTASTPRCPRAGGAESVRLRWPPQSEAAAAARHR